MPTTTLEQPKSRLRKAPNILSLLLVILAVCAIASYAIPAGAFERDDSGSIIPGSWAPVPQSWVSPVDLLVSIHTGLVDSAPIIFGILITGGMLHVLESHGVIATALHRLAVRAGASRYLVIVVIMLFFAVMSGLGAITSEVIAFFPLGVVLARAIGITPLTGVMAIVLSSGAGYGAAFINPSSLALAQTIAGVPLFSGMAYRMAIIAVFLAVVMVFVLLRVRRETRLAENPTARLTQESFASDGIGDVKERFTARHALALLAFFVSLGIFVAGTILFEWGVGEMAASFLFATILVAIIFRMQTSEVYDRFIDGMKSLVWVAAVVGIARAISVVLADGRILDTLVDALAQMLAGLPAEGGAVSLFLASSAVNFLVGSGTGQAALTMPIISPLTDLMGISQQVGVLSFQLGDGLTNMIYPTSASLVAALSVSNTSYGQWLRATGWVLALLMTLAAAAVVVAVWIGYN